MRNKEPKNTTGSLGRGDEGGEVDIASLKKIRKERLAKVVTAFYAQDKDNLYTFLKDLDDIELKIKSEMDRAK